MEAAPRSPVRIPTPPAAPWIPPGRCGRRRRTASTAASACPSYQLWGEEMDSPRGRIHLMTQALAGAQLTEEAFTHVDRCLGCMACVTACPSGVRYDRLIEAARTWTEEPPPGPSPGPARSLRERAVRAAIFATFPYPRRLRALSGPLRGA